MSKSIKVKEIKEKVYSYTRGNDGNINATVDFKKMYNYFSKFKEVLKDDDKTSTELLHSLDDLIYCILDYRYNIVDYGHYSKNDVDNGRCHLSVM